MMIKHVAALGLALCAGHGISQTIYESNVVVHQFAGSGIYGHQNGPAAEARFIDLNDIAIDAGNNLVVAENESHSHMMHNLRRIDPSGYVMTMFTSVYDFPFYYAHHSSLIAAPGTNTGVLLSCLRLSTFTNSTGGGEGALHYGLLPVWPTGQTEPFMEINSYYLSGAVRDSAGTLYAAVWNQVYKRNDFGDWVVFAGHFDRGYADGAGLNARFDRLDKMAVDTNDNVYVWDVNNRRIRKITPSGVVSTYAGNGTTNSNDSTVSRLSAGISDLAYMAFDRHNNLYFTCAHRVRKVTTTGVITVAGGAAGYANGPGDSAQFNNPQGIRVSPNGNIFVADSGNHRIRRVATSLVQPSGTRLLAEYSDGFGKVIIYGQTGMAYQIERSTNAVDWVPVHALILNESPFMWVDEDSEYRPACFYRTLLLN